MFVSNGQASVKTLKGYTFSSNKETECHEALKRLAIRSKVTLIWVLGHILIEGNKIADQLTHVG
jgi:ribonuclease HI